MATQTYHKPPPSLCHVPLTHTAQIVSALGDLLDDLQWVQDARAPLVLIISQLFGQKVGRELQT